MKNAAERREFLECAENWEIVEHTTHTRLSRIEYGGEYRYKLETYEMRYVFNYRTKEQEEQAEWVLRRYYKPTDKNGAGPLRDQSLTEIREWVADQDRKGAKL